MRFKPSSLMLSLLLLTCLTTFAAPASAQSSAPPDFSVNKTFTLAERATTPAPVFKQTAEAEPQADPVLRGCEQAVDELKLRRAQVDGLTAQNAAKDDQLKLYDQLVSRERERGDLFKQAAEARAGANSLDDRRDELRREQIALYAEETARLRDENDRLRRSRDRRSLFAFGAGAGAVLLAGR
jgi:TolA-binding protein